jgi:ketosteroid isomerase-like protein
MKECPRCRTRYTDDTLRFCLQDGTPLVELGEDAETETVVSPKRETQDSRPSAAPRRSRSKIGILALFAVLAAVFILSVGGVALWLAFHRDGPADNANNRNQASPGPSRSLSPSPSASPSVSPSPTSSTSLSPAFSPSSNASPAPQVDKPAIAREVNDTIASWRNDTESLDIDGLMRHYADRVDYYKTSGASRASIATDKERAFSRFDSIDIRITDLRVDVADSGEIATAEFDKAWRFVGDHVSEGRVRSRLKLKKAGGRWLITSEQDLKVY